MSNGIVRRPAVPPPVRIRRDVAKLSSSDPILVFYEKAIAVMQQGNRLDLSSSWRYQGAVHDYPSDPNTGRIDERRQHILGDMRTRVVVFSFVASDVSALL